MAGITDRTLFNEKLSNGQLRQCEFALVNTDLGAMVEPVPVAGVGQGIPNAPATVDDQYTANRVETINRDEFLGGQLTSGLQTPRLI